MVTDSKTLTTMKTRNIIILALTALFTASCHTWDAPGEDSGLDSYGNPSLKETNVRTIAEVKEMFKTEISTNDLKKVDQSLQIKAIVVGNDEGSNLYKKLCVQDNTGAFAISIDQSGLFGAFSVGQCVLIELKDLYVGSYEKQPQIGKLYFNENKGVDQVGRLTRYEWQRHYKLLSPVEGLSAKPIVTDNMSKLNLERDCGRLVTLVGIRMKDADGVKVFAPSDGSVTLLGGCANREIAGVSSDLAVIRTSTYAKFANMPMPTEKINITGIASRYRDGWQIEPRKLEDIQTYTGTEVLDDIDDGTPKVDPVGEGTAASPYNVSAALARAAALPQIESAKDANADNSFEAVVKGYVKSIKSIDTSYGNAEYTICDDADGLTKELTVYGGYSLNGEKFKSTNEIQVGDVLVVSGTIVNFKGTLEFTQGSKLLSINDQSGNSGGDTQTPSGDTMTKTVDGTVLTFTNSAVTGSTEVTVDFNAQGWANDTKVTSLTLENGTTIEFGGGENTSNAPKFYSATKGVRIYAKNIVTIKGNKPITKVVLNCDSYNGTNYVGNDLAYATVEGNTVTICNEHTSASGGTQIRVKTMVITYSE